MQRAVKPDCLLCKHAAVTVFYNLKYLLFIVGMGEESTAKFKLRLGLNLKSYKAYAKLRFRTEPISPFDIGDGISCAGKVSPSKL